MNRVGGGFPVSGMCIPRPAKSRSVASSFASSRASVEPTISEREVQLSIRGECGVVAATPCEREQGCHSCWATTGGVIVAMSGAVMLVGMISSLNLRVLDMLRGLVGWVAVDNVVSERGFEMIQGVGLMFLSDGDGGMSNSPPKDGGICT